ncbi:MAG: FMN-binding protein [Clostridia bacterium]|nr:FMN-binding protein [Clostridia bacterium]
MKNLIKSIVSLVCICSVVAVLMALTNAFTAPIIAKNEAQKANAALLEVLPDGGSFEEIDLSTYTLPKTVTAAYRAENGGYVVKLTTTGYSNGLILMCGIRADGTISGVACLASTETLGHEKTYGQNLVDKTADTIMSVDIVSGATKTTGAMRDAVRDALNATIILGGGSIDIRTEEEILADNLAQALPAANGEFEKYFFVEVVEGVDAIYLAKNQSGAVCVVGEQFIAVDAEGNVITECDAALAASVTAAVETISATETTDIDVTAYNPAPKTPLYYVESAKRTATGNYILEMRAVGYGILGGDSYHPASGEYILIRVSLTKEGRIIDCLTLSQAETDGVGSVCADEKFYGQFDGKTQDNYENVDAITITTNGYKEAIGRAFEAVKFLEGEAQE